MINSIDKDKLKDSLFNVYKSMPPAFRACDFFNEIVKNIDGDYLLPAIFNAPSVLKEVTNSTDVKDTPDEVFYVGYIKTLLDTIRMLKEDQSKPIAMRIK